MKEEKEVIWLGNSKKILLSFPLRVRKNMGYALHFAQNGIMHPHAKPLKGLGSGVYEIVENVNTDTYRTIYAVSGDRIKIYILHTFKKKSTQGIKTPQKELEIIRDRLKLMMELENGV